MVCRPNLISLIPIKLKSCAVELAEAEQTLMSHQKTTQTCQNRVQQLRETITERKRLNDDTMRNMEVQLVLKMGQIETQLSGNPRELDNAVVVPFDVVLGVNEGIVAAGRKKIGAMKRTMEFRRTIEWREWRHACMRRTLKDMKEDLKTLQGVKVILSGRARKMERCQWFFLFLLSCSLQDNHFLIWRVIVLNRSV